TTAFRFNQVVPNHFTQITTGRYRRTVVFVNQPTVNISNAFNIQPGHKAVTGCLNLSTRTAAVTFSNRSFQTVIYIRVVQGFSIRTATGIQRLIAELMVEITQRPIRTIATQQLGLAVTGCRNPFAIGLTDGGTNTGVKIRLTGRPVEQAMVQHPVTFYLRITGIHPGRSNGFAA